MGWAWEATKEAESQSKVTGMASGCPSKACSAYGYRADVKASSLQKLEAWIMYYPLVLMVACADKEIHSCMLSHSVPWDSLRTYGL